MREPTAPEQFEQPLRCYDEMHVDETCFEHLRDHLTLASASSKCDRNSKERLQAASRAATHGSRHGG
eukprot:840231-Pleurochrysis_carterae.AAC.2